jgi:branched-chain amino acid transport system ATP-binding protein
MTLLEIKRLTKHFGGLAAVSDLDFSINEGEILGLIGPNGAGKTTVYNMITGVFRPTSGNILYKGEPIMGLKPHIIAKKGIVRTWQQTNLFHEMSTYENMLIANHLHRKTGFWSALFGSPASRRDDREIPKRVMEILEYMGLIDFKDELVKNLPHGHQRALGVVMALSTDPCVLLLDEPVTGMNPEETKIVMDRIKAIRDRGITILLVEHDMQAIMGLSDRIVVMNFGKKIAEGSSQEIQNNDDVISAYLGTELKV